MQPNDAFFHLNKFASMAAALAFRLMKNNFVVFLDIAPRSCESASGLPRLSAYINLPLRGSLICGSAMPVQARSQLSPLN